MIAAPQQGCRPHSGGLTAIDSAIDEEMLLHSRHNLRIREFVCGLNIDGAVGQRFGSAQTLPEFQLGLTSYFFSPPSSCCLE
jgi:hypothetical protein